MTSGVNPAYFLRPIFEDTSHVEATLKVACDSFMRPGPCYATAAQSGFLIIEGAKLSR